MSLRVNPSFNFNHSESLLVLSDWTMVGEALTKSNLGRKPVSWSSFMQIKYSPG